MTTALGGNVTKILSIVCLIPVVLQRISSGLLQPLRVVDSGKVRIILGALVTLFDVTEIDEFSAP